MRKITKIIDLTHSIKEGMPIYPGDPVPKIRCAVTIERQGYNVHEITLGTHTGTHVDAPFHFSKRAKEAAEWLVRINVRAIGIDVMSVDSPDSRKLTVHKIFSDKILVIENLTNLDKIKEKRVFVIALPLKLEGVDGSPLRIVVFKLN
jgi:kynurenine formamidase